MGISFVEAGERADAAYLAGYRDAIRDILAGICTGDWKAVEEHGDEYMSRTREG